MGDLDLSLGKRQRERHSSVGDAALLVVVDSGGPYWERVIVDDTVLVALEHFGMPYRLLDLARDRPAAQMLEGCAGVVLAQNGLGASLDEAETGLLAAAVDAGVGLINLDYDLRQYEAPLLELFGFGRINPHPYVTSAVRIREQEHYITAMQEPGEYHELDRPVTAIAVEEWGAEVTPLADGILGRDQLVYIRHLAPWSAYEPRNYPLLFATRRGRGRAVQFALNQRVWLTPCHGRARGMDDLFWRAITWAVRKPFAANIVPPFATLSFDDCEGRHDFAYADIAAAHGYVPMPSLLLSRVPERLFPKIREGMQSGLLRFGAHALSYYELLVYDFGRGECTPEKLKGNFAVHDAFWDRVGEPPGPTLRLHWGEYGVRALPYLKERGYQYFCPALQSGLHKADMCLQQGFWPYDLQTCYYDYLPDDDGFFGFAAMAARGQEDFLTGCTVYLRESDHNDVEKAARSAARSIKLGLRGGFYAEMVTHEQKFESLSMPEWEQILARVEELTAQLEMQLTGHDEIGHYLRGKDGVWIDEAVVDGDRVSGSMAGATDTGLQRSVFVDEDDAAVRRYEALDAFEGRAEI